MESISAASILQVPTLATTKPNLYKSLVQVRSVWPVQWVWIHYPVFIKVVAIPMFAMPITALPSPLVHTQLYAYQARPVSVKLCLASAAT